MAFDSKNLSRLGEGALKSATVVVPIIIESFHPKSIVDVGCGTGEWLSIFKRHGCRILGLDGHSDLSMLSISPAEYRQVDAKSPLKIGERFDLVLCVEVAEHLPEESSDVLIESLVNLSDTVIFSAAIPHQGGNKHINEQWPSYWSKKFKSHGYVCLDFIRQKIWEEGNVDVWYKQNMFCYSNKVPDSLKKFVVESPLDCVHPYLWVRRSIIFDKFMKHPILIRIAKSLKIIPKVEI